ncbi:MAG TPA: hypothetical protein PLP19_16830 [bacterium]|nr:hypothetical protein [bacterium]HPN45159.1 hypothetical protein [bacterium]
MKKLCYPAILILFFCPPGNAQQTATIDQIGNNNQVMIEQIGFENAVNVIQKVSNSVSLIEQNGSRNEAFQLNSSFDVYNAYKQQITQKGYRNEASQNHLAGNNLGMQKITQTGNWNLASQVTTADASSAIISQAGNYNNAEEKILWPSNRGEATISQDGNHNNSLILIAGNQSRSQEDKATIISNGSYNGSNTQPVSILLVGDNHSATIEQGREGMISNNTAAINLVNPLNSNSDTGSNAKISQENGGNNTAYITSIGLNNGKSDINQDGDADRLQINQYGANHYGELNVFGSGLGGIITQTGNGSIVKVTRTN